jgi:hypothetical protein
MTEELKIKISAQVDKLKQGVNEAKKAVSNFTEGAEKGASEMDEAFKKAGDGIKNSLANAAKIGATAVAGIGTALIGSAAATEEYRVAQSKLNTAFSAAGSNATDAALTYESLYRVLGDGDRAVEAANHLAMLTTNARDLQDWTWICQGAYATFGDSLPIEGLTEAANETAKVGQLTGVLADALNWAGINEEDFQEQLDACNNEAEREALIRNQLLDLYTETAGQYEENAAGIIAQNEANSKLQKSLAKIGETMTPLLTQLTSLAGDVLAKLVPYIQQFAEKYGPTLQEVLSKAAGLVKEIVGYIVDNWEIIAGIAAVIGGIATAIGLYNTVAAVKAAMAAAEVTTVWALVAAYAAQAAAMVVALAPYLLIVAAIAAVIAIIVLCVKHWDTIKEAIGKAMEWIAEKVKAGFDAVVGFFKKIIDFIKENWQALLLMIVNPFAGAFKLLYDNCDGFRNFVDTWIKKIKDFFINGFQNIKEKAVNIFNTIKTAITNPIETAKNIIKGVVDQIKGFFNFKVELPKIKLPHFSIKPKGWKIGDLMDGKIPKLGIEWYAKGGVFERPTVFGMNGNKAMVGGEAGAEAIVPLEKNTKWLDKIADKLAGSTNRPVVLNVDGKVFAQTSINTINELTRQTGSLKLNIM